MELSLKIKVPSGSLVKPGVLCGREAGKISGRSRAGTARQDPEVTPDALVKGAFRYSEQSGCGSGPTAVWTVGTLAAPTPRAASGWEGFPAGDRRGVPPPGGPWQGLTIREAGATPEAAPSAVRLRLPEGGLRVARSVLN